MKTVGYSRVTILGQGAWGSALGSILELKGLSVQYLDVDSDAASWSKALSDQPLVVLATPFSALESLLKRLKSQKILGVVNVSKGIDRKTLFTFSQLASRYLKCPKATLSGPTFAQEVAERRPTACVVAGKDKSFVRKVAELFSNSYFRVYTSSDPQGVEVCGAIKNVLAIACGISDGLKLGLNARAALLTRGLVEMEALVRVFGGSARTVSGLAGVGDLWLTATGDLSRNRQLGLKIAEGISAEVARQELKGPAEGLYTVAQVHSIAKKRHLDLPICEQVYRICFEGLNAKEALIQLMSRDLKAEASKIERRQRTKPSKKRSRA